MNDRRPLRLRGYNYGSPGGYFVTICTKDRVEVFGTIVNDSVQLSELGDIVRRVWNALPAHYPDLVCDALVIMPNHVHAIVMLSTEGTEDGKLVPGREAGGVSLPEIIRAFKAFSARRVNDARGIPGAALWQRGYHDRIIRGDAELSEMRQYIAENPLAWAVDRERQV
jgi:REP element-mobilizing transposase RayT